MVERSNASVRSPTLPRVGGSNPGRSSSFIHFLTYSEKKRKTTKVSSNEEIRKKRERRVEDEGLAGVSGNRVVINKSSYEPPGTRV